MPTNAYNTYRELLGRTNPTLEECQGFFHEDLDPLVARLALLDIPGLPNEIINTLYAMVVTSKENHVIIDTALSTRFNHLKNTELLKQHAELFKKVASHQQIQLAKQRHAPLAKYL